MRGRHYRYSIVAHGGLRKECIADLRRMQRKLDPEGLKAHDAARKERLRAEELAREIADLI